MVLRPLDKQFGPGRVDQIRSLQARFRSLEVHQSSSRYLAYEVVRALEAGLLYASLTVATALLELAVRSTLLERLLSSLGDHGPRAAAVHRAIEDDPKFAFGRMVEKLVEFGVLDYDEEEALRTVYKRVRIPIHHAIVGRVARVRRTLHLPAQPIRGCRRGPRPRRSQLSSV